MISYILELFFITFCFGFGIGSAIYALGAASLNENKLRQIIKEELNKEERIND